MPDPLDLEALKEHAAKLRNDWNSGRPVSAMAHMLDTLDRAIEIAERADQTIRSVLLVHSRCVEGEIAWRGECQTNYPCRTVRIATAYYEQHRQTQEGEA